MKKIIGLITGIALAITSSAQLECSIGLNSTFTYFRGGGVEPYTYLSSSNGMGTIRSYDGFYGPKSGVGWSIEGTAQRTIAKPGFVFGISIGYERLNSHVILVREMSTITTVNYIAIQTHSVFGLIDLYPYLGKKFFLGKHVIEIDLGSELGLPLSAVLKVKGEPTYKTRKPEFDFRLRLQAKWRYKNYGLLAGYALGVSDYHGFLNNSRYAAYASVGKIGAFYTFSPKKRK